MTDPKRQTPQNCFAHNHMTPRQYGLYTRVRELQSKFGFIYFDGDDLAASFQATKRDVIYDDRRELIDGGWFVVLSERCRKKDGTWEATKIKALSHKEWAALHGGQCPPVAPRRLAKPATSCSTAIDQSLQSNHPVAPEQPSSRPTAIDQSLQSDKDLVQSRHDSRQTWFKLDNGSKQTGCDAKVLTEDFKLEKGSDPLSLTAERGSSLSRTARPQDKGRQPSPKPAAAPLPRKKFVPRWPDTAASSAIDEMLEGMEY